MMNVLIQKNNYMLFLVFNEQIPHVTNALSNVIHTNYFALSFFCHSPLSDSSNLSGISAGKRKPPHFQIVHRASSIVNPNASAL